MPERIRVFALGGLDEIGKSCYVVEINKDIFVVGCGVRRPDKTQPGVDYVIPDFTYLKENKERVKAYLLPHGHDDETGALAYLYRDVPAPIYGSAVTIAMFQNFCRHVNVDCKGFDFHIVSPSSFFKVNGRKITYFQTSHNTALSSGISIESEYGNLIFTSDFVVENNADKNYLHDMNALSKLGEEKTLCLFAESFYASKSGYTAPRYKLSPLIANKIKDAQGRTFVALLTPNSYNIDEVISLAIANRKKIIPYDKDTAETLSDMQKSGQLLIPNANFAPNEDINRIREQDMLVLVLGYADKIYRKIALLAAGQNDNGHDVRLKETDLFILAAPSDDSTELEATDALDELFRSGCHVTNISRKEFLLMHASEEDLKMMISVLHPNYYIPVKGFYKDLLANAQVAMNMHGKLNHTNIFLLDNGLSVLFDETGGHILNEAIPHGDILIDGSGVGDVGDQVLQDRQKLSEGVVILACTIDKKTHTILAGPDIQMRGLFILKDGEAVLREITKVFTSTLLDAINKSVSWNLNSVRQLVYEKCVYSIRRQTGKEPMVLPIIIEI